MSDEKSLLEQLERDVDFALAYPPNIPDLTFRAVDMAAILEVIRAALVLAETSVLLDDPRVKYEVSGWSGVAMVDTAKLDKLAETLRDIMAKEPSNTSPTSGE